MFARLRYLLQKFDASARITGTLLHFLGEYTPPLYPVPIPNMFLKIGMFQYF